jgi:hypothetical protein
MKGYLIRWLRLILPPLWVILVAVFFCMIIEGLYLWTRFCLSVPEIAEETSRQFLKARDGSVAAMMAVFGIFRVTAFHPLFRLKYRTWLEHTPWTGRKPLPLGPIHLVWQDAILVGVAILSLHGSTQGRLWPFVSFLSAYLGVLGFSFWSTGPRWMGYLVFFGLALAIRLAAYPFVGLGILAVVYAIAMIGLSMALRRFPWTDNKLLDDLSRTFLPNSSPRQKPIFVWPFSQLLDVPMGCKVNRRDGILGPLLAAWWMHALAWNISKTEDLNVIFVLMFFCTIGVFFGRVLIYIGPFWPPISLWGRIITRQWIISGYDYVLLAPLCIIATALIGWILTLLTFPDYVSISCPLATAAVLIVALNMGPSLRKWQLTGHHRIMSFNSGASDPNRVKL